MVQAQNKPIRVRFDGNGFYHPSYGKMGRGQNSGVIYTLPSFFAETETIDVDVRDPRTGVVSGTKKVTRRKHLPATAEIIEDDKLQEMRDEALNTSSKPPKVLTPKTANEEDLDKRRATVKKGQSSAGVARKAPARVVREA